MSKYLFWRDFIRESSDRNDPLKDNSIDVKTEEYPNYNVVNYNYKQSSLPGFYLLLGGSYGVLFGIFVGLPYIQWKYRRMGYRDFKLLEMLCIPLIKTVIYSTIGGIGCGALFEVKRIANEDLDNEQDYNKKVL